MGQNDHWMPDQVRYDGHDRIAFLHCDRASSGKVTGNVNTMNGILFSAGGDRRMIFSPLQESSSACCGSCGVFA